MSQTDDDQPWVWGAEPLDPGSPEPLYRQLASVLRSQVKERGRRDAFLEPRLSALYGLSRSTIRQALKVLQDEKLITPSAGRGWFIVWSPDKDGEEPADRD